MDVVPKKEFVVDGYPDAVYFWDEAHVRGDAGGCGGVSGASEGEEGRTVVVLKEGIGNADEPALLEGDAVVIGEDAVGEGRRRTCSWRGVSGEVGEEEEEEEGMSRTGEDVTEVGY